MCVCGKLMSISLLDDLEGITKELSETCKYLLVGSRFRIICPINVPYVDFIRFHRNRSFSITIGITTTRTNSMLNPFHSFLSELQYLLQLSQHYFYSYFMFNNGNSDINNYFIFALILILILIYYIAINGSH